MASAAEPPGKAAEYLRELTRIVAAQQELLARRGRRIEELERLVARLSRENAGLLERHRRHLAACAHLPDPDPGPQPLGASLEVCGLRYKWWLSSCVVSRGITSHVRRSLQARFSSPPSSMKENSDHVTLAVMLRGDAWTPNAGPRRERGYSSTAMDHSQEQC